METASIEIFQEEILPTFWDCERAAFKSPEVLDVSDWANRSIVLLDESAREPGPYRWQRTPYARAILDVYRKPSVRHIVLKTATQVAKTTVLYTLLGYIIDQDPYSTILMYPSDTECELVSRTRVQPMIDKSPVLKNRKLADPRKYQLTEMHFPGMILYLSSGSGVTGISQRPVRNLLRDEVNKYPEKIGKHGNPMDLSEERVKSFWDIRKIVDVSSPTDDMGAITLQEKKCQVILGYFVPCPHCLRRQRLEWNQVKFEVDKDLDIEDRIKHAKKTTHYECRFCKKSITDKYKEWMLASENGAGWYDVTLRITRPKDNHPLQVLVDFMEARGFHDIPLCFTHEDEDPMEMLFKNFEERETPLESIAFRLNSMYSPWITFGDMTEKFLTAHYATEKRFDKLKGFINDWLGEEYIPTITKKTEHEILRLKGDLPPLILPPEAVALTLAIDPRKNSFPFTVWAWAWDYTRWLIRYGEVLTWDLVRGLIYEDAYHTADGSHSLKIWRAAIDTGGTDNDEDGGTMTQQAYRFIADYGGNTIFAIKGASRESIYKVKPNLIGTWPGTKIPIRGGGIVLWNIDTNYYKDIFHNHLQIDAGKPGCIYLHNETGNDFANQITSEEKRRMPSGRMEWIHIRGANHYLDDSIYASVLVDPLCLGGLRVLQADSTEPVPQGVDEPKQNQRQEPVRDQPKQRWW